EVPRSSLRRFIRCSLYRTAQLPLAAAGSLGALVFCPRVAHAQYPAPDTAVTTPAPSPDAAPPDDSAHEITVQGNKADALKRASGSGTTIGQREIRNTQPESNAELLRRVPGLQVRAEDPMGLRLNLGVRGLSPSRSRLILMEEDGVPVVVSPYGEPELYYTPMVERVDRLDVQKGSDVLRYGPQTVGAVVQLHTFDPTVRPGWYVSDQVGSRGYGALQARYSGTTDDVGYVAQVVRKSGDGYRNMGFYQTDAFGKAVYTSSSTGQLSLKLGFHDDRARTTYTGLTDALFKEDPRRDTVAPNDFFAIRRYEASLVHEKHFSETTALRSTAFAYQMNLEQRLQDFDRQQAPNVDYAQVIDPLELSLRTTSTLRDRRYYVAGVSSELEHRFETGPAVHRLKAGARAIEDVARRKLKMGETPTADDGQLLTDDTTRILGLSTWLEDQVALTSKLLVTPAFRYEHSTSTKTFHTIQPDVGGATENVDFSATSHASGAMPGVGVIYGTAKANAFGSAYLGYSAPRVSQAITAQGKDANLHAERSRNYELGARARNEWVRAEADTFLIQFDNQLVSNNPLSGNSEFVDGGRTRHWGAEATATLRVGRGLALPLDVDLGAQYTFVQARFVGGDYNRRTVPYSPVNSANLTLDVAHPVGLGGQVAFAYVGSQYTDENNTVIGGPSGLDGVIDAYTTLDVGARYRYAPSGVSFGLSVKSLLDRVYISDRLPNGIFTAGFRQIYATFAWSSDG
ncbi:MAG TPA: TonB-dependent receptor, partial [Polyangiaceae bacterium]|nr:TonB-dependent receptor [Polyangiaceae bacterium]